EVRLPQPEQRILGAEAGMLAPPRGAPAEQPAVRALGRGPVSHRQHHVIEVAPNARRACHTTEQLFLADGIVLPRTRECGDRTSRSSRKSTSYGDFQAPIDGTSLAGSGARDPGIRRRFLSAKPA